MGYTTANLSHTVLERPAHRKLAALLGMTAVPVCTPYLHTSREQTWPSFHPDGCDCAGALQCCCCKLFTKLAEVSVSRDALTRLRTKLFPQLQLPSCKAVRGLGLCHKEGGVESLMDSRSTSTLGQC